MSNFKILATAAAMFLASCATVTDHGAAKIDTAGLEYVAMGSSFAAGSDREALKPDAPARCGRSTKNYATLLANRLNLSLTDVTCGGATTAHILDAWNELPAQIEALTPHTRLITLTIGGNDLNYAALLMTSGCTPDGKLRIGDQVFPCPSLPGPTEEDYAQLETNLNEIAKLAAERAPLAKLVFVQYVAMVPEALCDKTLLSTQEANMTREIGRRLAKITADAARHPNANLLPVDAMSQNHTPCGAEPWSYGSAAAYPNLKAAAWHPNDAGHAAIADALAKRLKSGEIALKP